MPFHLNSSSFHTWWSLSRKLAISTIDFALAELEGEGAVRSNFCSEFGYSRENSIRVANCISIITSKYRSSTSSQQGAAKVHHMLVPANAEEAGGFSITLEQSV